MRVGASDASGGRFHPWNAAKFEADGCKTSSPRRQKDKPARDIDLDDKRVEIPCLPEQRIAYWDAVLVREQAAWIETEQSHRIPRILIFRAKMISLLIS